MDGFNSKDFYGHSLSEDPKLRTTTRNYEFRFNSSEHLERIISRVKMDREKKKQRELLAGVGKCWASKEQQLNMTSKVETQIGRISSRETVVDLMSDEEIEAMISQAMMSKTCFPVTAEIPESNAFPKDLPAMDPVPKEILTNKAMVSKTCFPLTAEIARDLPAMDPVSEEILPNEAIGIQPEMDVHPSLDEEKIKIPKLSVEYLPTLEPQWVEIKPTQKSTTHIHDITISQTEESPESQDISAINLADKDLQSEEIQIEADQLSDVLSFDSKMDEDFVIRDEDSNYRIEAESPPDSPVSFGIDSLDDCERAEMERVLGRVEQNVPALELDNLDSEGESEVFEYLDKQDKDQEQVLQDDDNSSEIMEQHFQPIVHIKQFENHLEPKPILVQPPIESPHSPVTETAKSVRPMSRSSVVPTPRSSKVRPLLTPLDKRMKSQIEELKHEKIRIFCKMTSIQEKIVEVLDRLRSNLIELSLPDGYVERKLRERNALEFSVRFSRNYLFPLGRMIDELRVSPKEEYSSATTNEPCVKVCGIYGLINQALQCYHKQLRHFFTENVPKKLDVLISMVTDTTNMCLRKKIFDKRDTLIQCLLSRCDAFLHFIMEFAERRKSARNEEVSQRSGRRDQHKLAKTSSKWDLTMKLNNLNMYEPKLIPKKPKKMPKKKKIQTFSSRAELKSKHQKKSQVVFKDNDPVIMPAQDPIDTQVRKVSNAESVQMINNAIEKQPENELNTTVSETLQNITKDEVRQMLEPIVSDLGSILKNADNPQTVESMLGVLNMQLLAKNKQLKIDATATENSTQNGNTYQKEVTKKGSDSSKGERRKVNRQIRVSKTEETTSCNVKEGSTEQTERYDSRGGRTDTICDKQSLRNIDIAVVDDNDSMKQKTRSRSIVGGGAFLSAAVAAKKPTLALAAIRIGVPPPSLVVSPVQLDEVMPSPPLQTSTIPSKGMTSHCLEHSTSLPVVVPMSDKFAPECHGIGDGRELYAKGYRQEIASQSKVSDGAANAYLGIEGSQEAWQSNPPLSPQKNGAATSGQMKKFNYSSNALYAFVKYNEDSPNISPSEEHVVTDENEYDPEGQGDRVSTQSCTKLTKILPKPSQNDSFKSAVDSNENLFASAQVEEETRNEEDVKALLEERTHFFKQCKEDPLYSNPQFPQPWKVLSKISQSIAREIVGSFENDLSFGEESYVRDFINMEMQT